MNGCIYRTKDGECELYSEGGKYHAFCVGDEPCDGRKPSNADKIRAMTDEELVNAILTAFGYTPWCHVPCNETFFEACGKCMLNWLRQESDE